jgi:soluble lytic murein transglycosylase-like protein
MDDASLQRRTPLPRVTAENFRQICSCQTHQKTARARARLRRYLLLGLTVAVFGAVYPLDAFDLAFSEKTEADKAVIVAASALVADARPANGAIPFLADLDTTTFGRSLSLPNPLTIEKVREEFFRTEIPYGEIIYREARSQGLAPELVAAVVKTESDFRPRLISNKNAHGLMQLIPSTAALMGTTDVMDPVQNIRGGTRYLKHLQEQFDDPVMVLAAYNAGPGTVRVYGGVPPYRETRDYVKKVDRSTRRFQREVAKRIASYPR